MQSVHIISRAAVWLTILIAINHAIKIFIAINCTGTRNTSLWHRI